MEEKNSYVFYGEKPIVIESIDRYATIQLRINYAFYHITSQFAVLDHPRWVESTHFAEEFPPPIWMLNLKRKTFATLPSTWKRKSVVM